MKRRILYLEPVYHALFRPYYTALTDRIARPETTVDVMSLAARAVDGRALFAERTAEVDADLVDVATGAAASYDAVVIGCASDPAIDELRELLPVPVVGPFVASLLLAALGSRRIAVLTPEPASEVDWLRRRADAYGLGGVVHGVWPVQVGHPEPEEVDAAMAAAPDRLADAVLDKHRESLARGGTARLAAERAVQQEGAETVIFACTLWGGMLDEIARELPVVDPVTSSIRAAEALCA